MGSEAALFVSRIRHDRASFIEIRRGEGISGGDMVVVGVDEPEDEEYRDFMFFSPQLKLNRYRLSTRIRNIKVTATTSLLDASVINSADLKDIEEKLVKEGRASLPLVNDNYPSLLLVLTSYGDHVDVEVRLDAPAQTTRVERGEARISE